MSALQDIWSVWWPFMLILVPSLWILGWAVKHLAPDLHRTLGKLSVMWRDARAVSAPGRPVDCFRCDDPETARALGEPHHRDCLAGVVQSAWKR